MRVLSPYNYCYGHSFMLKFNIMSLNVIWHVSLEFKISYLIHLLTLKKGKDQVPFIHTPPSIWDCWHQTQSLLTTNIVFRVPLRTWPPLWAPFSLPFSKRWQRRYFSSQVILLSSFPLHDSLLIFNLFYTLSPYPSTTQGPCPSSLFCSISNISRKWCKKCKYWGYRGKMSLKS